MKRDTNSSPESMPDLAEQVQVLTALFSEQEARFTTKEARFATREAQFTAREEEYKNQIALLEEQVLFLKQKLFGRKSDQLPVDDRQLSFFSEEDAPSAAPAESSPEEITVSSHNRKKPGRKPLPESLPRVEVVHDLAESEKTCSCGCLKSCIGQEVSEQLDIIPARLQVIRHIRLKYACKGCEGVGSSDPTVMIAPAPVQLIDKSMASAGLLAHVLTAKFVDALPFYRQEKQFSRLGIDIPRSTMCNWAMHVAEACSPLQDLLINEIRSGPLINVDETTLKVLSEKTRSKCYMWVLCSEGISRQSVVYHYAPGRGGEVISDILADYRGYVQTDGYKGYDVLSRSEGIILVGCWAHVRRRFVDVTKIKGLKSKSSKKTNALTALEYIDKIYRFEKEHRKTIGSEAEFCARRASELTPELKKFHTFLRDLSMRTPPKGLLGKAVFYALNQWPRLCAYLERGYIRPDNNRAENAIRPFVVGRKNWLFSGNGKGAQASATLFSLIETAKANGVEPYAYLRYLFEKLPHVKQAAEYKKLLPQYLDPKLLV